MIPSTAVTTRRAGGRAGGVRGFSTNLPFRAFDSGMNSNPHFKSTSSATTHSQSGTTTAAASGRPARAREHSRRTRGKEERKKSARHPPSSHAPECRHTTRQKKSTIGFEMMVRPRTSPNGRNCRPTMSLIIVPRSREPCKMENS